MVVYGWGFFQTRFSFLHQDFGGQFADGCWGRRVDSISGQGAVEPQMRLMLATTWGRQLDSTPATIDVLPAIAEEVAGEACVGKASLSGLGMLHLECLVTLTMSLSFRKIARNGWTTHSALATTGYNYPCVGCDPSVPTRPWYEFFRGFSGNAVALPLLDTCYHTPLHSHHETYWI